MKITKAIVAVCFLLMFLIHSPSLIFSSQSEATPPACRYTLRDWPKTISKEDAQKEFGLTTRKRDWGKTDTAPCLYMDNQLEDMGEVVVDHATGLMWQKYSSDSAMIHAVAKNYVSHLNSLKFAGYDDWRLPTIPELMSLLESDMSSNGAYIDPYFKIPTVNFYSIWSADLLDSSGTAWFVDFGLGGVYYFPDNFNNFVRVVRP